MSAALSTNALNRAGLRLSILAWLHRANLTTPVSASFDPTIGWVALAEEEMNARLRARCMIVRAQQQIEGQYTTLPCDFLEMQDIRILGGPPLVYASREDTANADWYRAQGYLGGAPNAGFPMAPDFYPIINPPGVPWDGIPRYFTVVGSEMEVIPYPQLPANYDPTTGPVQWPVAEMAYYQRILLGPNDTDTNAVLGLYPACYIYGALMQSAPFLRDDSRVQLWATLFNEAIDRANTEHERARQAGSRLHQKYRRLA